MLKKVLGVSLAGKQEVLGLWIEEAEGARFWLMMFNDLKARGTQDVLIVLRGWINRLAQCRGIRISVSRCPALRGASHPLCDEVRFLEGSQTGVCRHAPDLHGAHRGGRPTCTGPLRTILGSPLSGVSSAWRNHGDELTTFFKYPVELRRIIYTTNAIESLHFADAQEHLQPQGFSARRGGFKNPLSEHPQLFQPLEQTPSWDIS